MKYRVNFSIPDKDNVFLLDLKRLKMISVFYKNISLFCNQIDIGLRLIRKLKNIYENLKLKNMNIIAIILLTVPFVFIIIIEWLRIKERRKLYELRAELYAKALEMGQPIPNDVLTKLKKRTNPLNTGMICIAVGLGLSLFIWSISFAGFDPKGVSFFRALASVGNIPIFVGIAFIIIHFIEKKKPGSEDAK